MTLPFAKLGFKIQKKFLAFFTLVPLLAATAFIQVPCPVCNGTGFISSTGMSGVELGDLNSVELDTFLVGCDSYRVYQYDINMTLHNAGTLDAGGYVSVLLINTQTGQLLDTEYTVAAVPIGMSVQMHFTTSFMVSTTLDQAEITEVRAKVLTSDVPCKACDGKAKVALNSWPLLDAMKKTFVQSQMITIPYIAPVYVETEANPGDF